MITVVRDAFEPYTLRIGRPPAPIQADHGRAIADGTVWVIVLGRWIAGAMTLAESDDHLEVVSLAITPSMQHRGLGTRLLDFAEERARELGRSEVHLFTNEAMTENLSYYGRRGYVESDRRADHGYRRVFLIKRLGLP